ncbi:MAG: hypothetical protein WBY71_02965, partial [Nitrososphaeraceae archaeon]
MCTNDIVWVRIWKVDSIQCNVKRVEELEANKSGVCKIQHPTFSPLKIGLKERLSISGSQPNFQRLL